jgi:N-acetylmuramoyl-L-alanine amidase
MSKLIALDDGHGMQTIGKRTPMLPGSSTFMHENEFNRAVVGYLDEELKRCGFRTLHVAPGDEDTALKTRVTSANNANADLYLSIHANANTGQWGTWGGIETFVFPKGESIRIGKACHNRLVGGTKLRDRGVKDGSHLYVIKYTDMPSVLFECAFMDNLEEARLLMSDAYRRECAKEIAQGVCDAYGIKYVEVVVEQPKPIAKTAKLKASEDGVYWNGIKLAKGQIGRLYVLKPINLWNPDRKTHRVLQPGEVIRVYGEGDRDNYKYEVGAGYTVSNVETHVRYEKADDDLIEANEVFYGGAK